MNFLMKTKDVTSVSHPVEPVFQNLLMIVKTVNMVISWTLMGKSVTNVMVNALNV